MSTYIVIDIVFPIKGKIIDDVIDAMNSDEYRSLRSSQKYISSYLRES